MKIVSTTYNDIPVPRKITLDQSSIDSQPHRYGGGRIHFLTPDSLPKTDCVVEYVYVVCGTNKFKVSWRAIQMNQNQSVM